MQTYHHHAAAMAAFLIELVKLVPQCLFVGRCAPTDEWEGNDVVEMKRIRDSHEVAALERHNERLVTTRLIDVIDEAQALQDVQCFWRIAHPVGIPSNGVMAGGLHDTFHSVRDEAPLNFRRKGVAVLPSAPVRGGLMPTLDDLTREIGRFVDSLPNHE